MVDDETLDRQLREAAPYIDDEASPRAVAICQYALIHDGCVQ
jgi:hypothetical protein